METLSSLFEKLSQYNILNNLIPGSILCASLYYFCGYSFLFDNTLMNIALVYFIGMVNSRFSSLLIEPLLQKIRFVKFASHSRFVAAEQLDKKVTILSQENNMYRSFISVFTLVILTKAYRNLETILQFVKSYEDWILLVLLVLLFAFSYRKQTSYVSKRVEQLVPAAPQNEG